MIDIAQRIRCLWTPSAPDIRVKRSELVGALTAELRRSGWPAEGDEDRRRTASRLLFARWLVMTGQAREYP